MRSFVHQHVNHPLLEPSACSCLLWISVLDKPVLYVAAILMDMYIAEAGNRSQNILFDLQSEQLLGHN